MKPVLSFFFLFCLATTNAQFSSNTNQWIDYEKIYYKIQVAEDGIYQINFETLKDQDIPIETINGNQLCLISQGEEVPLYVSNTANWEPGDYLQFYGKKLDGEFDKRLYKDPDHQLHSYWSQFTDTSVYFLAVKEPSSKIIEIENDLSNVPDKEDFFIHESILFENKQFSLGTEDLRLDWLPVEGSDYEPRKFSSHFASYGEGEGFAGRTYANNVTSIDNSVIHEVPTPSIFNNNSNAFIQFKVLGASNDTAIINDHHFKAYLNDSVITEDSFEAYSAKSYQAEVPLSMLSNELTQIKFEASHPEARVDRQLFSFVKIEYPRDFNFSGINHFAFNIANKPNGNYIEFENLLEGQTYWLYDLTYHLKLKLYYNETEQIHQAYLPTQEGSQQRQFILQKASTIKTIEVNNIQKTTFTDYSLPANQGDYIIITHSKLIGGEDAVSKYSNYRSSEEGGKYEVTTVNVEELYDQYSYGIRKHPLAIKYFLNNALNDWVLSPRHCFLLGKGIKNSRCRLNPETWMRNLVPTFGDTPNDQYFGSTSFDPLSNIAIGRLSATKETEILNYLNKVKQVEQNTIEDCNYINEAKWKHHILHVGGGNSGSRQQLDFKERLENQADVAANGSLTANSSYLFKNPMNDFERCITLNEEDETSHFLPFECLDYALETGLQVINFLGHANNLLWEVDIKEPKDYSFNNRYPVMISQSSFNADVYKTFADEDRKTMPEIWLHPKDAGVTAFIGFIYLAEMHYGADFIDEVYNQIYVEKPQATLGEQVNAAINHHYNEQVLETLHVINQLAFLGDPALRYAFNYKPELAINEEQLEVIFDQLNDTNYNIQLKFDFERLNIPIEEAVPYKIFLVNSDTEEVVAEGTLKDGESVHFQKEFTLLPGEQHQFLIEIDADNKYDEICEDNNSIYIKVNDFLLDDGTYLTNQTSFIKNYPNPFDEQTVFNITLPDLLLQNTTFLSIANLNGQEVKKWVLQPTNSQQQITWNGTNEAGSFLSAGVYWYQLKNKNGEAISKANKLVLF